MRGRMFLFTVMALLAVFVLASIATANPTPQTPPTEKVCTDGKCTVVDATPVVTSTPFTSTVTTTTTWKKEITTYEKRTKRTIVVWYSTKRLVPKQGTKCYAVGRGTKYAWFWNSYRRASDGKQIWFKDTRRSTLCGTGKHAARGKNLKRTACQNPARLPTQPAPPKARILKKKHVREFRSITLVKKFLLEQGSETRTTVTTGSTTTTTYVCPTGFTKIDGTNKCKKCEPPTCVEVPKDGTDTPPPPGPGHPNPAPGPNPPPHPDDPTRTPDNPSGSWQCYDEVTGNPVPTRSDGTCPAGSWGSA